MKPSDFTVFPSDSIFHNTETEDIALNIMAILARTGDTFRNLGWDEYKAERQVDGHFTENERGYFDNVIGYCVSSDTAVRFSPMWAGVR